MAKKPNRTPLVAIIALIVVLAVAVGARMLVWSGGDHGGAGTASIGGPFTLTDHDGKTASDADFRGRFMLIYFGYTFCPDVCPTSLGVTAAALDKLSPGDRRLVAPIFISVDPERDRPAVLKDYVGAFHPDLIGMTGTPEQLAPVLKAYKVYAAKVKSDDPQAYTMDHSSILYLMGPDGKFLAHFPHGTSADEVAAGLKKHLK
ncbi:MAG TPA: SCO family protein [Candidatus Omnitrophota bacterium]|nr:SCO family protein [Candidatus Omnitrophota bacterium]